MHIWYSIYNFELGKKTDAKRVGGGRGEIHSPLHAPPPQPYMYVCTTIIVILLMQIVHYTNSLYLLKHWFLLMETNLENG